jgi:hypothetical protein
MSTLDTLHYEGNLLDKLADLERRLAALERTELSGVVGPVGPTGATGATGATGPAGPGSPAGAVEGDIVYYDAVPEAVVLNIGTATQLLQVNAGATAPEWVTADAANLANRTRVMLVDAVGCANITGGTQANRAWRGWAMADAAQCECYGSMRIPADFASTFTVNGIFESPSAGDCRCDVHWTFGALGENYTTHASNTGAEDKTIAANILSTMTANGAPAAAALGDYMQLKFTRYGNHANDTVGDTVYFVGFIVTYTADM